MIAAKRLQDSARITLRSLSSRVPNSGSHPRQRDIGREDLLFEVQHHLQTCEALAGVHSSAHFELLYRTVSVRVGGVGVVGGWAQGARVENQQTTGWEVAGERWNKATH